MHTNEGQIILPERAGANGKSTGRIWEIAPYVRITTLVVPSTTLWALFPSKTLPSTREHLARNQSRPREPPASPLAQENFQAPKLRVAGHRRRPQLSAITTLSTPPSFPRPRMAYPHQAAADSRVLVLACPPAVRNNCTRSGWWPNQRRKCWRRKPLPALSVLSDLGGGVVSISSPSKFVQKRVNLELLRSIEIKVRVYVPFLILQISR